MLANIDDDYADGYEQIIGDAGVASIIVHVPGGHIRYYYADGRFEATCERKDHMTCEGSACRLTRIALCGDLADEAAGRPLGTLVDWLALGHTWDDRDDHRDPFFIACLEYKDRVESRNYLKRIHNGIDMLNCERKLRPSENEELLSVPMRW